MRFALASVACYVGGGMRKRKEKEMEGEGSLSRRKKNVPPKNPNCGSAGRKKKGQGSLCIHPCPAGDGRVFIDPR